MIGHIPPDMTMSIAERATEKQLWKDADIAIEFGELLATAADDFLTALNHRDAAQQLSEFGAEHAADEALTDHWKALQDAVYEFRKRAARAGHKPSAEKFNR